ARGDHVDRYVDQARQALEVGARVRRQRLIGGDADRRLAPAGQLLVDRLHFPVGAVADADANGVEAIEYVELGNARARDARIDDRAPQGHRVEPPAATPPAGDRAELMTHARQVFTVLIEELRGKGTRADPRGIGLDDAKHGVEGARTQPRAGARESGGRVR